MSGSTPFGLRFFPGTAEQAAACVLRPRDALDGPGLVATPNVDHVVRLRRHGAFARAYLGAEMVLCDGAPLRAYAWLRGRRVRRVTGIDLTEAVLRHSDPGQRLFFVLDSAGSAVAVRDWAAARGAAASVATHVPRPGFATDPLRGRALAQAVRAHRTTILIMAVGAPRSEVFADTWRAELPPCWVLCTGQAVKVALGLVRRAPAPMRWAQAEWLWRLMQEPRRLASRYALGAVLFPLAMIEDFFGVFPRAGLPVRGEEVP